MAAHWRYTEDRLWCAIRDLDTDGPLYATPPTDTDFRYVSAGESHACAMHEDGTVTCWGSNTYGQLDSVGVFAR